MKNYYKILQIEYSAVDSDIKSAYRILAKKYHPDLNQGDASVAVKFREVKEAYELLSDAEKRTAHDFALEQAGIDTGRFSGFGSIEDEDEKPQEKPQAQRPTAKKPTVKQKGKAPPPKFKTRAERAAYAMQLVKKKKAFTRNVIIISVSVVLAFAIGGLFLGLHLGGVFVPTYTVAFDLNGGGDTISIPVPTNQTVRRGGLVIRPAVNPERESKNEQIVWEFSGWYTSPTGGDSWNFTNNGVLGDITLYAQWLSNFRVVFTAGTNGALYADTLPDIPQQTIK